MAIAPNGQKSVYGMFTKPAEDSQDANAVAKSTTVLTKIHHVARTQRTSGIGIEGYGMALHKGKVA